MPLCEAVRSSSRPEPHVSCQVSPVVEAAPRRVGGTRAGGNAYEQVAVSPVPATWRGWGRGDPGSRARECRVVAARRQPRSPCRHRRKKASRCGRYIPQRGSARRGVTEGYPSNLPRIFPESSPKPRRPSLGTALGGDTRGTPDGKTPPMEAPTPQQAVENRAMPGANDRSITVAAVPCEGCGDVSGRGTKDAAAGASSPGRSMMEGRLRC